MSSWLVQGGFLPWACHGGRRVRCIGAGQRRRCVVFGGPGTRRWCSRGVVLLFRGGERLVQGCVGVLPGALCRCVGLGRGMSVVGLCSRGVSSLGMARRSGCRGSGQRSCSAKPVVRLGGGGSGVGLAGQGPFFFSGARRAEGCCSRVCVSLLGQHGRGAVSWCMFQDALGAGRWSSVVRSAYQAVVVVVSS